MEGGNFGHYSSKKIRLTGGLGYVMNTVRNSLHLMWRYPSEALWAPVWLGWHKGWKIGHYLVIGLLVILEPVPWNNVQHIAVTI